MSRACDAARLSGGAADGAYCNRLSYDAAAGSFARLPVLVPAGNVDPPLGSFFPADARVPAASAAAQAGLRLVPQRGWGGGPNVSLGPQAGAVWGVHATPATAGGTRGAAVLLSWHLGAAAVNDTGPGGPPVDTPSPAAFMPSRLSVSASVLFAARGGPASFATLAPTCLQYRRNYTADATRGHAYTSPLVCHATLEGLAPGTSYAYSLNATVVAAGNATAYGTPAALGAPLPFAVNTAPARGAPPPPGAYPQRWVVMSDVGMTFNSSLTAQYIGAYMDAATATQPGQRSGVDLVLNAGDFSYADSYGPGNPQRTCAQLGGASCGGTAQQRTDGWFTMWQPVLSRAAAVHAAGNHELETDGLAAARLGPDDGPATYGVRGGNAPFQSYATRTPSGATPPAAWGDTWSALYFSQDLGPAHVVVLQNYVPFAPGSAQHAWFVADMTRVDRAATPWLVVVFHASPYHSYLTHYKEMECFMSVYEPLFYAWRVDFVFSGHVHAYERTHPVYNYRRDACGPVYITLGDGGNVEGPYRNFVDERVPGSNATYCAAAWGAALQRTPDSNAASGLPPEYQARVHPPGCPTATYQRASGVRAGPGAVPDARLPPSAEPRYFCQSSQPEWSAFREPAFGFAALTLLSDDAANFTWFRNVDQAPGAPLRGADTVSYRRYKGACPSSTAPPKAPVPAAPKQAGRRGIGTFGGAVLALLLIAGAVGGAFVWRSRRAAAEARGAPGENDDDGAGDVRLLPR